MRITPYSRRWADGAFWMTCALDFWRFISAAGVSHDQGATCYNLNELPMKHHAMRRARQRVLVADSSKYGKVLPARIGALSRFDLLVSDSAPDATLSQWLAQQSIPVRLP